MAIDTETLKKLPLFHSFKEELLEEILPSLKAAYCPAGTAIFEENAPGESLFIILSGEVRIEKRLDEEGKTFKVLGISEAGDFFGEMSAIEPSTRSARAVANADSEVLEVGRTALQKLIASAPEAAVAFYAAIAKGISGRLRRTSMELTMLYDLSQLITVRHISEKDFMARVLGETRLHLEGVWSNQAYLYNMFNEDTELAAEDGPSRPRCPEVDNPDQSSRWLDANTYISVLHGNKRPEGFFVFHAPRELNATEKASLGIAFNTLGYIAVSILSNIKSEQEELLRKKLQSQKYR